MDGLTAPLQWLYAVRTKSISFHRFPLLHRFYSQYSHISWNMSHISQTRKLRHRKNLSKIAQLASSGTGRIKRQHPLLPEKWPGWEQGQGPWQKFQSFREQTLNLSFLSGGLDPTKLKATEKHTEQLGKKMKYKVRSQGETVGCLFFYVLFCFLPFLLTQ